MYNTMILPLFYSAYFKTCIRICRFALFALCFWGQNVFSYEADIEDTLSTAPNIDATEYVLITNNNLEQTRLYLQRLREKIKKGDELEVRKNIRLMHLYYLEAYSYLYHSSVISKSERNKAIFDLVEQVREFGEGVLVQYKAASDVRRVMAVSMMLMADTGVWGLNKFMNVRRLAIKYAVDALALNENNIMARVVLNNFDSLAIGLVGANAERGFKAINVEVQTEWKKPHVFEFYVSQIFAFLKKRDKENALVSFEKARALYPGGWRLKKLHAKIQ